MKINLAVDRLPVFASHPDFDPQVHGGTIVLAESLDDLENAFQDAVGRAALPGPVRRHLHPSVFDDSLAPAGQHVISMFTQWVPHTYAQQTDEAALAAYADRVVARMETVAPGFADSVLHRQVIGPRQMQEEYGLVGGNIFHGELTLGQMFHGAAAAGLCRPADTDSGFVPGWLGDTRRWRGHRHSRTERGASSACRPTVRPVAPPGPTCSSVHGGPVLGTRVPGRPRSELGISGHDRRPGPGEALRQVAVGRVLVAGSRRGQLVYRRCQPRRDVGLGVAPVRTHTRTVVVRALARPANRRICWLPGPGSADFLPDVGRQIPSVDNSAGPAAFSDGQKILYAHPGQNVRAGQSRCESLAGVLSTVASPGCAQHLRRVCTTCPQACAHHDSTVRATR